LTSAHAALLAFLSITLAAGETEKEVELSADQLKQLNDKFSEAGTTATKLTAAEAEVSKLKGEATTKDTEITGLKEKITTLEGEVTSLKNADAGRVTKLRDEAKRVYTALKADKADASILASFDKADEAVLTANIKQYTEELETKFPSTCSDCGSHNVSKASATLGEGAEGGKKPEGIKLKTDAEVEKEFLDGAAPKFALDK